jgi:hypothetical protein
VQDGFFAQQLETVVPEAVTIGTDEVNADGQLVRPWSVDYGKVTPILVKAVQDLNGKVDTQIAMNGQVLEGLTNVNAKIAQLTDGLTAVSGSVTAINTALDVVNQRIASIDGRVTALENAPVAAPAVQAPAVTNTTVVNNITQAQEDTKQVGNVTVKSGKIGVKVKFSPAYTDAPAVYITPVGNNASYTVSDVTATGFTLKLNSVAAEDTAFNWLSIVIGAASGNTDQIDAPVVQSVSQSSPVGPAPVPAGGVVSPAN